MLLITGSDGMLGSWVMYRGRHDVIGFTHSELDITDEYDVMHTLKQFMPDAIINCAGVTTRRNADPNTRHRVNAEAPHVLAKACDVHGIRLVQVSTDCVFKGRTGGDYSEVDPPDADDNYGWTKAQGEVIYNPHITVRTSFVGWPDPKMRGLLAWLHSTAQDQVPGYKNVLWNGLTAPVLADFLIEVAYGRQTGVMHLYGPTKVSKYELLLAAQRAFGKGWRYPKVYPADVPVVDRTLSTVRHDQPTINPPTIEEQLRDMAWHEDKFNKEWRKGFK